METHPAFTELDLLTADEVEALRDLFCACSDLHHEIRSAHAQGHRVDQLLGNALRYSEGRAFTRHADVLLEFETATVDYLKAVERLAWQQVSACVVVATALLHRLAHGAPGLSPGDLRQLTAEPMLSDLCAALSMPGEVLLPRSRSGPVRWFDQDREKMLIKAQSFAGASPKGSLDFRVTDHLEAVTFGDLEPWFAWADWLVTQEIASWGASPIRP
ncbi:hypothetical protein [Streptomyces sp. BH055]|uniref:hypothetical protein n=1 Tax=Streptomyces sp. BH055 TaxID=3401173 RepID=UPI003BB61DBB